MYTFFKSSFFNFECIRILTTIPFGGAELGECLDAITQIRNDDPSSWYLAWIAQGEKAENLALLAAAHGDRISARDAYLRASNYFRTSSYMFNDRPESPDVRVLQLFERSIACFRHAITLLDHEVKVIEIPYENGCKLPGYLFLPSAEKRGSSGKKVPMLVNVNGADSTSEELYSLYAAAGVERGYAVLIFDGPGQGAVLRRDRVYMRPDGEAVTSRVMDHIYFMVQQDPDLNLDLDKVAIAGASMGAYFALRGAAADHRYAACVSLDPFYSMFDLATSRMPPWFIHNWLSGWPITDNVFNFIWKLLSRFNFQLKWELTHVMWIFGKPDAAAAMHEMRRYTLDNVGGVEDERGKKDDKDGEGEEEDDDDDEGSESFLGRLHCPVLVTGAMGTIYTPPSISTDRIHNALAHLDDEDKERMRWVADQMGEGGLQGKVGAWRLAQQKTFEFLDRVLHVKKEAIPVTK
ncbi:MAG: hypothetical protein Q9214_002522 [Letrouitia sp. 1 TL-2023]